MLVMKFGGTSVGDPARIVNLCDIVAARRARDVVVVVVSAASRVTDMLLTAAREAAGGQADMTVVETRVMGLLSAFGLDRFVVSAELDGLRAVLGGIATAGVVTAEALDAVASYGERISARGIAAVLTQRGTPAEALDAYDVGMVTDDCFGGAEPLPASAGLLAAALTRRARVPVVTGFIGKTLDGRVTTLGRGGSDYSAAVVGAALDAKEIEIWTDVPGVMTADPRVVPGARTIAMLSFSEAAELAYFGAKVLHPKTIHPAVRRGIPVRVKNTFEPGHPGTVITAEGDREAQGARAIAHKRGIAVVNLVSTRMLLAHGFLAQLFEVFRRHHVVVDLVATSEVSVSCTVDREDGLDAALAELGGVGDVTVSRGRTLVCVIAAGSIAGPEVYGGVFRALAAEGVRVELISMGASAINVSVVVPDADGERSVRALHRTLLAASA